MDIHFDDGKQFAQLSGRFRKAGKNGAAMRKELTATIQKDLTVIADEIRSEARSMVVTGQRTAKSRNRKSPGRGSLARERFDVAKEMRRQEVAALKGKKTRARRSTMGTGLRARVAASVKSRVQYTGFRMGAKVYVESSNLPHSQRKLPRHLDNPKGWRHPVWGNREVWVAEYGQPYFTNPVRRNLVRVSKNIREAVNRVLRILR